MTSPHSLPTTSELEASLTVLKDTGNKGEHFSYWIIITQLCCGLSVIINQESSNKQSHTRRDKI